MEPKAPNPLTPVRRALAAAALAATVCSGCMTPATIVAKPEVVTTVATKPSPAPTPVPPTPAKDGQAARLTTAWNNQVLYAPDPTRGGAAMPGVLGRLYVFGPDEGIPLKGDGELIVDLWDHTPVRAGGEPKLLEVWRFDRVGLAKMTKRDIIGEGYSIFLPWSTYNVDIRQVHMIARYTSADGRVLMSAPASLSVDHSATLAKAAEKIGLTPLGTDAKLPGGHERP